ncbi:MAG: aspartate/glutamate racemase family protein [Candidatus Kapaibacterium sp.]
MLGILDWGIGGLDFYSQFKRERPDAGVVYLSDAGCTPYGKLPRKALLSRVTLAVEFLMDNGATHVVVACNAASTVLPSISPSINENVLGIIDSGVETVKRTGVRNVGIVGGERTIRSGQYQRNLAAAGVLARGRIAQPLSGMIERGEHRSEKFRQEVDRIVRPLKGSEALLLACTHYPAALEAFQQILPGTAILDPTDHLLQHILLSANLTISEQVDRILPTGNPTDMVKGAGAAFGLQLSHVSRVRLG